MSATGTLYIVSTPIGNLEDITLRALRILKEVAVIAAEDTRHTRKLLAAYDIHTPLTSYFDHNERQKSAYLVERLLQGESIALVSDAGTPGISDPGYEVIRAALAQAVPVAPIPGPSAVITALTVAGLPVESFVFLGFLPNKASARQKILTHALAETRTLIMYVSPHALLYALEDMQNLLGNRPVAVTRELTKKFEEIVRGDLASALAHFRAKPSIKGEFTIVLGGAVVSPEAAPRDDEALLTALRACMADEQVSKKVAVKQIAVRFGLPKQRVYQVSLRLE